MASVTPAMRHLSACLGCVRQVANGRALNGAATRLLSTTAAPNAQMQLQAEAPKPARKHTPTIGHRRRRALWNVVLNKTPLAQLPYQCYQEARKFLLEDRNEKIEKIKLQKMRLDNLIKQDPAVSGGEMAKELRIESMKRHIDELIILADVNDPRVKKRFEDGEGML